MDNICKKCNKSFAKPSNLQRHVQSGICEKEAKQHCPACPKTFQFKRELTKHIKEDHPEISAKILPELSCPKCGREFTKKPNLERHLKTGACEKVDKYHCTVCSRSFWLKKELTTHIRKEHPDETGEIIPELKCSKCGKIFSKKPNLDRHVESGACDKGLPKHQCPICPASFANKRSLEKHILKDHPSDASELLSNLTCSKCFKVFEKANKLKMHQEKGYCTKWETRHSCPECGKTYKFRKRMLKHMRDFHPEKAPPIKPHRLADVGEYRCCDETFANGREYRTHKDRVHIRKPEDTTAKRMMTFICKDCDVEFERKSELIMHRDEQHPPEHLSSDEDELPKYFKCLYRGCQERFQSRVELIDHKDTHREPENQNNFTCDLCGDWFESTDEVRHHKMDNHDIPGHSRHLAYLRCKHPGCDDRFDKRSDLVNHTKSRHEVQCERCDQRLKNENELNIHSMDEHDPNDDPESQENLLNDLESLLDSASAKSLYTKIGVDILDKAGEKMFKSTRTRQSFKLTPKALRLCEVGLALEVLNKVIGSLFKKTLEKGGYIQIKVLSDSLDTPIVMPLIKVELFDPLVLLNYIETVMSSKDELALDQTLTFDVIHMEDIKGSGRLNTMTMESFIKRRSGIFDPRNWDNRCLGLCLAAWELITRLRNEGEDIRKATFFKDPNNSHELKIISSRLFAEAGVDSEKECGDYELQRFQYLFNDRHGKQIIVLNEEHEHIFTGQLAREEIDQLFLFLYANHYFLIMNLQEFIGQRNRFCHRCLSIYRATRRHL